MGGNQSKQPNIQNPGQYHQHFRQVSQDCRTGPVQQRSCNDTCCLVFFIIFSLIFLILGCVFIANSQFWDTNHVTESFAKIGSQSTTSSRSSFNHMQAQDQFDFKSIDFARIIGVIIGMTILCILMSIVFLCLLSKFPKCMVYSMIALSILTLLAVIVLGIILKQYLFSLFALVFLAIMGCFLCCYKQQIEVGIVLLKVTGQFLQQKPSVFMAPILVSFISFPVFFFLIASLIAIQLNFPNQDQKFPRDLFSGIWIFLSTFYGFFFYYVLVFLIAVASALWYYSIDKNYLFTGLRWIFKSHIGSFTFASIIVSIVSSARQASEQGSQNSGNNCVACCLCFVSCCFSFIEQLLKVLNHNSIIVMSVTGETYIDSAKSTISIILGNFGLFLIVDIIGNLVSFCIGIAVIVIPAILGYLLIRQVQSNPSDEEVVIGVIGIIFLCAIAANLFLSVLTEALSCIFVFYCFDKRFAELGYPVVNQVPSSMKSLFRQIQQEGGGSYQMANRNDNQWGRNNNDYNNNNNQWNNNQNRW